MSKLFLAFPAFVVAVFGLLLAVIGLSIGWASPILFASIVAFIGWLSDFLARRYVLYKHPVTAVWMMEVWALCPGALAAIASAFLILASVKLKPEGVTLPPEVKELSSAFLTALTALVTAGFIKAADDADENWIAPHVRNAFWVRYQSKDNTVPPKHNVYYFTLGASEIERWVYRGSYGGADGWSFINRHRRAAGISRALRSNDKPDPSRT